jgi:NADPH-dependent glutamate synthase beta subunit-like oxidoreductase
MGRATIIDMTDTPTSRHVVAVVGAATAGSEIAHILAQRDALVVVIEQNPRPYGKIEDGLPRWHVKQRKDEYEEINQRLDHPNIQYVPSTRMGRDIDFEELRQRWGLSAIILTHGAWRDRPFPVEGADDFIGRGLAYQNPLIHWFNHYREKAYSGPHYILPPGATVVGGGLASIDVVKVLMIETTLAALARRGIEEDMLRLEREGVEPVLKSRNLAWPDLAIAPCKLFYRRRVLDMPLSDIAPDANPRRAEAMRQARAKILDKARRKYLFEFEERRVPTGLIVEGGRLAGVQMSHTEVTDGKVTTLPDTQEAVRSELTVSSIGSIPEPIPGIPQRGEVYLYADQKNGLLMEGRTAVYAAGNVLTGKGNIKDSLDSGTEVGIRVAEQYLGLADDGTRASLAEGARNEAREEGEKMAAAIVSREPLDSATVADILRRVRERQRTVGYDGDYRKWLARVTPSDLQ